MRPPRPIKIRRFAAVAAKARSKPRELETPIHMTILQGLQVALLPGSMIHHSPNEVNASGDNVRLAVAKQREMGTSPGWPDFEIVAAFKDRDKPGKWGVIEVKSDEGRLSEEQKKRKAEFEALKVPYCLARSWNDVEQWLEWEGFETRVRKWKKI